MNQEINVRWSWLKGMYIYTIVGAGAFGLGILTVPAFMQSTFGWPTQDPIIFGVSGSVFLAFALLSILGLRAPLKFSPLLLLSLCYKVIWFAAVFAPLVITGNFPKYGILHVAIFASYIIGNVIAIPFSYVFAGDSRQ
jgi:hypothetical protein